MIQDLEQKLDSSLEELALVQSELEELKGHSQEQIERLKQQLEETEVELQVKEKELKKLKLHQLMGDQINPTQTRGSLHQSSTRNVNSRNTTGRLSLGLETRRQTTIDLVQSARNVVPPQLFSQRMDDASKLDHDG